MNEPRRLSLCFSVEHSRFQIRVLERGPLAGCYKGFLKDSP